MLVSNVLTRAKIPLKLLNTVAGQMPKAGITTGGRVGIGNREGPGVANEIGCLSEVQRLAGMDFDARYRELLRSARRENVAFYPITPAGLQAPVTKEGIDYVKQTTDDLISLANETDGVAIVNTNDMNAGFRRIADDLAAYYVLGYYTTNTKFDGGLRNIKVRYKSNGGAIRARRQYRAPTEAEIAALASGVGGTSSAAPGAPPPPSAYETALIALERASRPFAVYAASAANQLTVVTELSAASILAGKWKDGADVEIVAAAVNGEPVATARGKIEPGAFSTVDATADSHGAAGPADGAPARRRHSGGRRLDRAGTVDRHADRRRRGVPDGTRAPRRGRSPPSSSPATSASAPSGRCSRRSIGAKCACSIGPASRCRSSCRSRKIRRRKRWWWRCRSRDSGAGTT